MCTLQEGVFGILHFERMLYLRLASASILGLCLVFNEQAFLYPHVHWQEIYEKCLPATDGMYFATQPFYESGAFCNQHWYHETLTS